MKRSLSIVALLMLSGSALSQSLELGDTSGGGFKLRYTGSLGSGNVSLDSNNDGSGGSVVETGEPGANAQLGSCGDFTVADTTEEANYVAFYNKLGNSFSTGDELLTAINSGTLSLNVDYSLTDSDVYSFPCNIAGVQYGNLAISGYGAPDGRYLNLTSLDFLEGLTHVNGLQLSYVNTSSGGAIQSRALDSIEYIEYYSNSSSNLTSNFSSLHTINNGFNFSDYQDTTESFPTFPALTQLNGAVTIKESDVDIVGLDSVASGPMMIRLDELVGKVDVFNSLLDVTVLYLQDSSPTSYNSFTSLETAGNLYFNDNYDVPSNLLTNLHPALNRVDNNLNVQRNAFIGNGVFSIANTNPLYLNYVNFDYNTDLHTITGFDRLTSYQTLYIGRYNQGLRVVDGFNFEEPTDISDIYGYAALLAPDLQIIRGFANVTDMYSLQLNASSLTTFDAFHDLRTLQYLQLSNFQFNDMSAFQNLTDIALRIEWFTDASTPFTLNDISHIQHLRPPILRFVFESSNVSQDLTMATKANASSPLCVGISSGDVVVSKNVSTYIEGMSVGNLHTQYTPAEALNLLCE